MSGPVCLGVEQLESRNTPSGPPFAGGAFLPPGIAVAYGTGVYAPTPAQVGRDGSLAFLPPGLDRAYPDHNNAPPPVEVGRDGLVTFLPPAAAQLLS
jgi:hypothetical protein